MDRNPTNPKDRIIVALDVDLAEQAERLVRNLLPYVGGFKIGLQLMTAMGAPQAVGLVRSLDGRVFLDGKFNDIPNTMAGAARAASGLGVWMFDVHASSGLYAMRAAVEHKGASLVLAVTVLTSMDDLEVARVFGCQAENAVKRLAKLAADAKCDGIVCSPRDLEALKDDDRFAGLLKVTPGVRPTWAQNNDQQRVMTPGEAIEAGADYLVIGRPITKPSAHEGRIPSLAARMIAEEIQAALAKRGRR